MQMKELKHDRLMVFERVSDNRSQKTPTNTTFIFIVHSWGPCNILPKLLQKKKKPNPELFTNTSNSCDVLVCSLNF